MTQEYIKKISDKPIKNALLTILDLVWPIRKHELPKFLAVSLLMFCILFIQNVIRCLKDSIVNTMISTEVIAFLKVGGVLPAALFMAVLYIKMTHKIRPEKIFYIILTSFLIFFSVFGFILFPFKHYIHLDSNQASYYISLFPNFKWIILIFTNWSFSLFYVIAELWPNAVFALLFWQFVNSITNIDESKRFYPLFGLLGQTSLFIAGVFLYKLPLINSFAMKYFNLNADRENLHIAFIISIVLLFGIIAIATFYWINEKLLPPDSKPVFKPPKKKISLMESIDIVLKSKYIGLMTLLLICYGMSINLVEGPWKAKARLLYPTTEEYSSFAGQYIGSTGLMTLALVLICSNMIRRLGWVATAIVTPAMLTFLGIIFFVSDNFHTFTSYAASLLSIDVDPISIAIFIGAALNVCVKSSKYTLFDATKEIAYVPLDDQLKTKGKAAADMIGIKFGKSLGAIIQVLVFTIFPSATYQSISLYLMVIFVIISFIWFWATFKLGKEYKKVVSDK